MRGDMHNKCLYSGKTKLSKDDWYRRQISAACVGAALMLLAGCTQGQPGEDSGPDFAGDYPIRLDASYGASGMASTDWGLRFQDLTEGRALVADPDGKATVAGMVVSDHHQIALVRYLPSGQLDTSFGEGGRFVSRFNRSELAANDIARQRSGRYIVAGDIDASFVAAAVTADGKVDLSFGQGGTSVIGHAPSIGSAQKVLVDGQDRIYLAGTGSGGWQTVARLLPDGSPDPAWGKNGLVRRQLLGPTEVTAAAMQPDGRLLVGGYETIRGAVAYAVVTRFNQDGSVDMSFGGNEAGVPDGTARVSVTNWGWVRAIGIQSDGRIVAAGQVSTSTGSKPDELIFRLTTAGKLDATFGSGGMTRVEIKNGIETSNLAWAMTVTPDDKILTTGPASFPYKANGMSLTGGGSTLLRYTANGQLDTSFGNEGKRVLFPKTFNPDSRAIAVLADGSVLLAGTNNNSGPDSIAAWKIKP